MKDDRLDYAIVFPWKDRHTDQVLGATYQGTIIDYERFGDRGTYKHIDINPTPNHGFNVLLGSPKNLKFFESPIDLLSYVALNRETVKDTWLISMDGLKDAVVGHYVREAVTELAPKEEFPESIEICVDNDRAGHIFWDKVHRLGVSNPFTGKAVYFEPDLPNDWQVPRKYQTIYEEVGKEMNVAPEAIMAIHKIENNLTENNQIVSFGEIHGVFAKKLAPKEKVQTIDVKEKCIEAAQQLKSCEKSDGTYDFDRFYRGKGKINEEIQISLKAKHYFEGYKNHDHEFVSEVKKDWNDQWKHEIQQQEIRKQNVLCYFNKADNKKGSEGSTMKTVILAEKPSQAKAYADSFSKATRKDGYFEIQDRLFSGETVITYGFGHLVELDSPDMYDEKWKQWALEHLPIFPTHYRYHVPKDKKKQFNVVKQQLQSADTIIIATDSDREGELIAWTIIQQAGADQGKPIKDFGSTP